jgi:rod shape-determining protein MreC
LARVQEGRGHRVLLGTLVLAHLVAIGHQVDGGAGVSLLERSLFVLLSPLQRGSAAALDGLDALWSGYFDLRGVRDENRHLRERVQGLETALQERQARAAEAGRLRQLLELRELLPLTTVAAEVVARDGMPWYRVAVINKGEQDGVALNAPVISATGVVGRVIERGPRAARVQLLLDRDSALGALVERTRAAGVVAGRVGSPDVSRGAAAPGELLMKYVPAAADVAEQDLVVSSGSERIFPKGLVIGRVSSVSLGTGLFKEIRIAPAASFDRLEEVLVLRVTDGAELAIAETVK